MTVRRPLLAVLLALGAAVPAGALADPYTEGSPPGANDFDCKPTAVHPNPVVLVHGLGATMQANWYWMSPRIVAQGYCVFALTYGLTTSNPPPFNDMGGTRRMEDSSLELAGFVDRVLTATGAKKVDVVGHSEGSLMPNHYVRFNPASRYTEGPLIGQSKVDRYVGMTPLWNGTNVAETATISEAGGPTGLPDMVKDGLAANGCASCPEFIQGSPFIQKMNSAGGPRHAGVTYTMIMTTHDELVVPYTSGNMAGATNIVMQDQCPADPSEHMALATNPNTLLDVLNALDPAHPRPVDCTTLLNVN
jgi:hypothetical protein